MRDLIQDASPKDCEIDVWLHSPGGDANAAYKLSLGLRSRCRKLRVAIPDYAKSAATLFALGCDEIYMDKDSELGPLDVQIEHPDREGVTVSGLDVAKALGFIADLACQYIIKAGYNIYRSTELPRREVLHEICHFSAAFFQPAVSKIDPHIIHRAANQLDIAQRYAEIMLEERNVDSGHEFAEQSASRVVNHFINHYPAHDFVISRDEARQWELPIVDLEKYRLEHQLREMFDSFIEDGEDPLIAAFKIDRENDDENNSENNGGTGNDGAKSNAES